MKVTHALGFGIAHTTFMLCLTAGLIAWHESLMSLVLYSAFSITQVRQIWFLSLGGAAILLAFLAAGLQYALRNTQMRHVNIPGYLAWFTALITIGFMAYG